MMERTSNRDGELCRLFFSSDNIAEITQQKSSNSTRVRTELSRFKRLLIPSKNHSRDFLEQRFLGDLFLLQLLNDSIAVSGEIT